MERLNLSEELNEAKIYCSSVINTPTSRFKSDNVKQIKGTVIKRAIVTTRKPTTATNKVIKSTQRRRSLTMTDIRNKMPEQNRTPIKHMKQDSCSTTDYSPRLSNEHPAEEMLTIRRRELQIRTFAKMFYILWRKQKNQAENFKDEVSQLQVQTSFLKNLRDKECESREKMTNLADKLKTDIIDLTEQVSQLTKERDILLNFCQKFQQEYEGCLEFAEKSSVELEGAHEQNQLAIVKVKELGDLMDSRFIGLKRTLRWIEEIDNKAQQHLSAFHLIQEQQFHSANTIAKLERTTKTLQEQLKTKEENEKNLKETIKELRKSLENSTAKNSDLKSQVKNMKLQLEYIEQQVKEKELRSYPWSDIARRAARLSMYLLIQVGILPAF